MKLRNVTVGIGEFNLNRLTELGCIQNNNYKYFLKSFPKAGTGKNYGFKINCGDYKGDKDLSEQYHLIFTLEELKIVHKEISKVIDKFSLEEIVIN